MKLFEFTQEQVIVNKDIAQIKAFAKILEKKNAEALVSYIYHLCDYSSPYSIYSKDEREQRVKNDFLGGKNPDKDVLNAIEKYKELSTTESLLLLESARNAVKQLRDYFDSVDFTVSEEPGKEAKDLMQNLKSVGAIIKSLQDWEEQIKKETNNTDTRKNVQLTKYNT